MRYQIPRRNLNKPEYRNLPLVLEFFNDFFHYLSLRIRQTFIFTYAMANLSSIYNKKIKSFIIFKMFWGRTNFYRLLFHCLIIAMSIVVIISGLNLRLVTVTSAAEAIEYNNLEGIDGNNDFFRQSGTVDFVSIDQNNIKDYPVYKHKVKTGDTLETIAKVYKVSQDTIKWANNLNNDILTVGDVLTVPGIDGVFIVVKAGDTVENLAEKYKSEVDYIIDLNSNLIDRRNPQLKVGTKLFLYKGIIPINKELIIDNFASGDQYWYNIGDPSSINVPAGFFVHPLGTDTACDGWTWSRGFYYYNAYSNHGGADMAKAGGCWINSAGNGKVAFAGYGYQGQGYYVVIDHGGGIYTLYYHGSGAFNVRTGDQVQAGQKIMYMGCSGNCDGTHLHFEVRLNGVKYNPENFLSLR